MTRWRTVNSKAARQIGYGSCVYVIYRDGKVVYVGKTDALYYRLYGHRAKGLNFRDADVTVKYSFERRYGESAMREIRLIALLNPPLNKAYRLSPAQMEDKPWLPPRWQREEAA